MKWCSCSCSKQIASGVAFEQEREGWFFFFFWGGGGWVAACLCAGEISG